MILGAECYAISIANKIQLEEYSTGSGTGGALYATDRDGDRNIFNVEHDSDDLWLNANNGHPDNVWNADNRFVFARRNYPRFSPSLGEFCF
jgi:hypothetical protein